MLVKLNLLFVINDKLSWKDATVCNHKKYRHWRAVCEVDGSGERDRKNRRDTEETKKQHCKLSHFAQQFSSTWNSIWMHFCCCFYLFIRSLPFPSVVSSISLVFRSLWVLVVVAVLLLLFNIHLVLLNLIWCYSVAVFSPLYIFLCHFIAHFFKQQLITTFPSFTRYGNRIIYFHQQIFSNAVKLIHRNIDSIFFSLFCFFSNCVQFIDMDELKGIKKNTTSKQSHAIFQLCYALFMQKKIVFNLSNQ